MKKKIPHIEQIETLINTYGSKTIAGLLGVSERAIQLWIAEPERDPRREKLKISKFAKCHGLLAPS